MLKKRSALSKAHIERSSKIIQRFVVKLKEFQSAKIVGTYFATGSEVRTSLIIREAAKLGKKVALPRTEGDRINFYEVTTMILPPSSSPSSKVQQKQDQEEDREIAALLVAGRFGILEPPQSSHALADSSIDMLVVPGVAFDKQGYRIGYGKGYFDNFLSSLYSNKGNLQQGRLFTIGLAYSFQLVKSLPHGRHDRRLDAVATESGVIRF